jgi:hypothetical protein
VIGKEKLVTSDDQAETFKIMQNFEHMQIVEMDIVAIFWVVVVDCNVLEAPLNTACKFSSAGIFFEYHVRI